MNGPDLIALIGPIARHFFGPPNPRLSSKTELRFGSNGSLSVDLVKGVWYDHEKKVGGNLIDMIKMQARLTTARECDEWAEDHGFIQPKTNGSCPGLGKIVATYDYEDEVSAFLFQVVKFDPKTFRQRVRDPTSPDGWLWSVKGVRQVVYKLPQVLEALGNDQRILIVEGEKDVEACWARGIPATCNPGGAGKWRESYNKTFAGGDIIAVADNDEAGRKHAEQISAQLKSIAARIRILDLGKYWAECPQKGDMSKYFDAGNSVERLNEIADQLPDWTPAQQQYSTQLFDPWQRYIVPAFRLEILPPVLKHFVITQSDILGCDRSALAMTTLAAVSGALDHRFAVKLMRHGDWWASPRLWVLLVGDPSIKKTPIINAATNYLDKLQASAWTKYKNDLDEYRKAGGDADEFEMPEPPRYVAYDITTDKLGIILGKQDRGILIKRDELAGWIGSMERYSTGRGPYADRAFWLKSYDGGPFAVDRVSREDVRINNLSCSIIGGIQPNRLAEVQGLTTDGLLQRFIPVMVSGSKLPLDRPTSTEEARYNRLLHCLIGLAPRKLFLTDDAFRPLQDAREYLYNLEQTSAVGLHEGFQGFVGKLPGVLGSIALLLTLARDSDNAATSVQREAVEDATILVRDFILQHAFEFYRSTERAAGAERIQRLASWILTSGKDRIVPSDLTTNVADMRGLGLGDVNQRVSPLVAGGWLTANEPGPWAKSWTVTPAVHEYFEERAQEEKRRKAELAQLINPMGHAKQEDHPSDTPETGKT
jgi:hypothetical protein